MDIFSVSADLLVALPLVKLLHASELLPFVDISCSSIMALGLISSLGVSFVIIGEEVVIVIGTILDSIVLPPISFSGVILGEQAFVATLGKVPVT